MCDMQQEQTTTLVEYFCTRLSILTCKQCLSDVFLQKCVDQMKRLLRLLVRCMYCTVMGKLQQVVCCGECGGVWCECLLVLSGHACRLWGCGIMVCTAQTRKAIL